MGRVLSKISTVVNIKISFIKIFGNIIRAFTNGGKKIFLF